MTNIKLKKTINKLLLTFVLFFGLLLCAKTTITPLVGGFWYCNNCQSNQESWAEHPSHKKDEEYRRDSKCWRCDKHSLIYTINQKQQYINLTAQRTSVPGTIYEVERFATWWNNNCAIAISKYNDYYRVYLLVYDKENNSSISKRLWL